MKKHVKHNKSVLGIIDIGTSRITCAIIDISEGQPKMRGIADVPHAAARTGKVTDMGRMVEAIAAAVDQAERAADERLSSVVLAVSCGVGALPAQAEIRLEKGAVSAADIPVLAARVRAHAEEQSGDSQTILHLMTQGYWIDGVREIDDPVGMAGSQFAAKALAITVQASALKNIRLCVERCQLDVERVVAAPVMSGYCLPEAMRASASVLDFGAGATTAVRFEAGAPVDCISVPAGGDLVAADLGYALHISPAQAGGILLGHGSLVDPGCDDPVLDIALPASDAGDKVDVRRSDLVRVIRPRVLEILHAVGGEGEDELGRWAGTRMMLCGGTVALPGFVEAAAEAFGVPVRRLSPSWNLPGLASEATPERAAAIGTALFLAEASRRDLLIIKAGREKPSMLRRLGDWIAGH